MIATIATIFGVCLIAIVLASTSFNKAKKGKKYSTLLIVGLVLYALALLGSFVGNSSIETLIGSAFSIVLLAVMFPICKSQQKKQ